MKVELKKAEREDLKEIAKIYMEEFSKPPYREPWTLKKAEKKMNVFSKYCDIWKIIYEEKIAGFIVINPSQWCPGEFIFGEEMAIKPELQGKGIGTEVWKQIFRMYKERGFKTFIGIQNKNSKVKNLYNRLGIRESKENVILERRLQ